MTSITLRAFFGNRLFTMSIRMCSFERRVHGEHIRKTMLNRTHCNSSQEFDDMSNIFRTVALAAEISTVIRISQLVHRPIRVLIVSMTRLTLRNDSTTFPSAAGAKPGGAWPGCSGLRAATPRRHCAASYSGRSGRRQPKVRAVPAWRTAREPGGVHGRSEIPPPNVYVAYRDRNDHHWKGVEGKIGRAHV